MTELEIELLKLDLEYYKKQTLLMHGMLLDLSSPPETKDYHAVLLSRMGKMGQALSKFKNDQESHAEAMRRLKRKHKRAEEQEERFE